MTTIQQTTAKPNSPRRKQNPSGKNKQINQQENSINEAASSTPFQMLESDAANEQALECFEATTHQQLEECAKFFNKTKTLQYALESDLLACDAKWTLFVSAAFSYRFDAVLQPFPPQFVTEQSGYDIDFLMSVIKDTPNLRVVLQNLMEQSYTEPPSEVLNLLNWVLIELREPALRLVEGEELDALLHSIDEKPIKIKPTHVFEVNALTGYHSQLAFQQRTLNLPLKLAFMSNKLDTYFSILQNGFAPLIGDKNPLLLTTDLLTSLQQSPYCAAWGASQCGSVISCTSICEFALNTEDDQIIANKNDKSCVDIHLNNPQNMRLRYLIFYGRRLPRSLLPKRRFFSWISNYKFSFSFLSYMLLLVSIGIANSDFGETIRMYLSQKINFVFDFFRKIITKEPIQ